MKQELLNLLFFLFSVIFIPSGVYLRGIESLPALGNALICAGSLFFFSLFLEWIKSIVEITAASKGGSE